VVNIFSQVIMRFQSCFAKVYSMRNADPQVYCILLGQNNVQVKLSIMQVHVYSKWLPRSISILYRQCDHLPVRVVLKKTVVGN